MSYWNDGKGYPYSNPYHVYNPPTVAPGATYPTKEEEYRQYYAQPPTQTPMARPRHISGPSSGNIPVGAPVSAPVLSAGPPGQTPMARPKHLSGSRQQSQPVGLKSALKNHGRSASGDAGVPLVRPRTASDARRNALTRQRSNSAPRFVTDHVFLSIHGSNELRIDNVRPAALEQLQEQILPIWPHGVDSLDAEGHIWRVRFTKNPWSCKGLDAIIARRMILRIFFVLAYLGYSHLTSINTSNPPPRLVFVSTDAQIQSRLFLASFSRGGHQVQLVDPPSHIGESLPETLRSALPHKIASRVSEDGIYTIELKQNSFGAQGVDKDIFASHVLQQINSMGYNLEATIPLARGSPFGFGRRKEIWIFKERPWRSGGYPGGAW